MKTLDGFQDSLRHLREELSLCCKNYSREEGSVTILPVTKRLPLDAVRFSALAGFASVGENLVQEGVRKAAEYAGDMKWELIGHLQSNKVKAAVGVFDRIQSVDSEKLVQRLDRLLGESGQTLRILIQVNTAEDPAKHGIQPGDAPALVEAALNCPNLILEGFMTIGRLSENPSDAELAFSTLRELRDRMAGVFGRPFPELSMGMSGDIGMAVKCGSTQVRVGTMLFGERPAVS